MIRASFLALSLAVAAPSLAAADRYALDDEHLSVAFYVDHIGFARQLGVFREVEGGFTYDQTARSLSDLKVVIEADSVDTFHRGRNRHVKNDDFLAADDHDQITFTMTGAEPTGETAGKVMGDLTIRGVTQPVTLDVTLNRIAEYPFGHKELTIGFSATAVIKRSDYGMTYALEGGLVGDEVEIVIEGEAIRQ